MAAGVVQVPWYATGLRGDKLAAALAEIAAVALRYGARSYSVYRYNDDRYKFLQLAEFDSKTDFERYWYGPEFSAFRTLASSWFQIPVVYGWSEKIASGSLEGEPVAEGAPAGESGDGDLAG
jgi:hypothetical protein